LELPSLAQTCVLACPSVSDFSFVDPFQWLIVSGDAFLE
jgi:hypothetical protein